MISDPDESMTHSGKYYRTNLEGGRSVYSPLRDTATQSPPTTPSSRPCKGKSLPIAPPLPDSDMSAHLKLPTFKGVGDEDMDRFWFVADSV